MVPDAPVHSGLPEIDDPESTWFTAVSSKHIPLFTGKARIDMQSVLCLLGGK